MPDATDGLVVPEAARAMETAHFFQGVVNGINFANEWDLRAVTGTDFLAVETADGDELCRTARSEVEHPWDVLSWMANEPALRLAMAAVRSANAPVGPPGKQPPPPRGAQELRRIEASKTEIAEKLERLIAKEREERSLAQRARDALLMEWSDGETAAHRLGKLRDVLDPGWRDGDKTSEEVAGD